MKRLLVFALVASMGSTSLVFAEESLLKSGSRHVQQLSGSETSSAVTAAKKPVLSTPIVTVGKSAVAPALQGGGGQTLQTSGIGKGRKWLLAIGAAVAVAGSMYAIDQRVEDTTPSSLGTRRDTCPGAPHCN